MQQRIRFAASDCVCDLFPPLPTDMLDDTLEHTRFTRCVAIPSGKARWGKSPRMQAANTGSLPSPEVPFALWPGRATKDADLSGLKELQALNFEDTFSGSVTDAGLAALTSLTQLQSLSVGRTEITDAGVKPLAQCRELRSLHLPGQPVDATIRELSRAFPAATITAARPPYTM